MGCFNILGNHESRIIYPALNKEEKKAYGL